MWLFLAIPDVKNISYLHRYGITVKISSLIALQNSDNQFTISEGYDCESLVDKRDESPWESGFLWEDVCVMIFFDNNLLSSSMRPVHIDLF